MARSFYALWGHAGLPVFQPKVLGDIVKVRIHLIGFAVDGDGVPCGHFRFLETGKL